MGSPLADNRPGATISVNRDLGAGPRLRVHAAVAGVLLGFAVPVIRRSAGEGPGLAEHFEHRWRPLSASLAFPVFAFLAAGVTIGGAGGLSSALHDPVAVVVLVGLVVGKPVGLLGSTWLLPASPAPSWTPIWRGGTC